jgi:hypothetical protein
VAAEELLAVVLGGLLVATVLLSALRTVVLPQGQLPGITRFVFAVANRIFTGSNPRRILPRKLSGLYAPAALVSLPFAWSMLIALGFALVFWGLDVGSLDDAWITSGSSLFTLGFARPADDDLIWLTFVEATIGLGIVALLISFLPTLYTAYSAREQGVGTLAPLTGTPPWGPQLVARLHAAQSLRDKGIWTDTSAWFVAVEQTHTAFPALSGFPPQQADRSWVATSGAVLDAAALLLAVAEVDRAGLGEHRADLGAVVLAMAHGSSAIARVARTAGLDVEDPPTLLGLVGGDAGGEADIAVTREEFRAGLDLLVEAGLFTAGDVDEDHAWARFAQFRAGYDHPLRGLAGLTHAPAAPWTTDRALVVGRPRFFSKRPVDTREP